MDKLCIGIPSWLPDDKEARKQRIDRLDRLVNQIKELFDLPIIFIAQNWGFYRPRYNKSIIVKKDCLGILKARKTLFDTFLKSKYDYMILFDDDAIIEGNVNLCKKYINDIQLKDKVFAFVKCDKPTCKYTKYADSQLNLCCISKSLYKECPLPDIDPQKSEGFEDRIWSTLLHYSKGEYEIDVPNGLRCIHFKNANETAPSTWASRDKNWKGMRLRTNQIEHYIYLHHHLPRNLKEF